MGNSISKENKKIVVVVVVIRRKGRRTKPSSDFHCRDFFFFFHRVFNSELVTSMKTEPRVVIKKKPTFSIFIEEFSENNVNKNYKFH